MNATDTAALIAELDGGCNGGDLPDLLNRAARALEAADKIITEAKAANAAPHANTKQSNSRMTAVESVLARWNPAAS